MEPKSKLNTFIKQLLVVSKTYFQSLNRILKTFNMISINLDYFL